LPGDLSEDVHWHRYWHGNLGIAHGITGPLALLAVAMKRGVAVAGRAGAIGRICPWTDRWRRRARPR